MITRRFLLAITPAAILGLRASAFTPGDSWSSKQLEDWSEKDIHQILTKSPWAKQVPVDFGDLNGTRPIAPADKDVTFVSAIRPLRIKAKFLLKDMVYKGRLEL